MASSDKFIAFGAAGKLASSTDGINWTPVISSSFGSSDIRSVAVAANGVYVASGADGKIASSFDGVSWVQSTSSFGTSQINAIYEGTQRSVAVGDSGKIALSV